MAHQCRRASANAGQRPQPDRTRADPTQSLWHPGLSLNEWRYRSVSRVFTRIMAKQHNTLGVAEIWLREPTIGQTVHRSGIARTAPPH